MSKTAKNILRRAILVVLGLVLGVNVYVLNANTVAQNALPMPFGIGCAVVQSGSMEPTYHKGDLLFVKEQESYEVGDVVVYQSQSLLVVHRIIATYDNEVVTQGDANNTSDAPFNTSSIKGSVIGCIPGVGYVVDFMKTPIGIFLLLAVALLLIELSFRKEKRTPKTDEQALRLEQIKAEIARLKGELGIEQANMGQPNNSGTPTGVMQNTPANVMPGASQNVILSEAKNLNPDPYQQPQQAGTWQQAGQQTPPYANNAYNSATTHRANDFSMPDDTRSSRFKNIFNNGLKHKHTSNKEDEEIEPFSEWLASAQDPSQARVQGMPQAQTQSLPHLQYQTQAQLQGVSQTQAQVQGSFYPQTGPLNQGGSQDRNTGQTNGFGGVTQQQRADQQQYQTTTREIQGY